MVFIPGANGKKSMINENYVRLMYSQSDTYGLVPLYLQSYLLLLGSKFSKFQLAMITKMTNKFYEIRERDNIDINFYRKSEIKDLDETTIETLYQRALVYVTCTSVN